MVGGSCVTLTGLFFNKLITVSAVSNQAGLQIRQNVTTSSQGTTPFSGTDVPATQTPTGRTGFGFVENTISVTGLTIALAPGTYWMSVRPVLTGSQLSIVSTTSGANQVGTPGPSAALESANGGLPTEELFPRVSMGAIAAVPEPSTLALLSTSLLPLGTLLLRKRQRKV